MSNPTDLILTLQQYIVELQTENKALKSHIFNLQNKQEGLNCTFHDEIEKMKVYVQHCENEIMKRERREVNMLEMIQELQYSKEEIARERDIYIGEIENIKKEIDTIKKEAVEKQEQIMRMTALQASKPPQPKQTKCKMCQMYIKNTQMMQQKLYQSEETIRDLKKDMICLTDFL